jgi:hypothetical protein
MQNAFIKVLHAPILTSCEKAGHHPEDESSHFKVSNQFYYLFKKYCNWQL